MNILQLVQIIAGGVGVLGLLMLLGIFEKKKKTLKNSKIMLVVGVVLLLTLFPAVSTAIGGAVPFLSNPVNLQTQAIGGGGTGASTGGSTNVDVIGCDRSATITYTLSAQDKYNGTGAVGGTDRYRLNGGAWTTVSDGGTVSGSPYQTLEVLFGNGATSGYYSQPQTYELPCGVKTFSPQLVLNGSLTSTVKDNFGTIVALATNNMSVAAGDVKDATVILSGQFQRDYPYGLVAVVDWNNTMIDDAKLMQGGQVFPTANIPQTYTDIHKTGEVGTRAYLLPAIISNSDLEFKVNIDVDDTFGAATGSDNVTITYFPLNYFVNEDKGGTWDGPAAEDEDNAVTYTGGTTSVIYVE